MRSQLVNQKEFQTLKCSYILESELVRFDSHVVYSQPKKLP